MDNRCIGVFDSGLGGLTCVRELSKVLPDEQVIYFGDTGRVPYGSRSEETIIKYVRGDISFLLTHPVKVVVAACGTASTIAIPALKDEYDVPIIGVVESAVTAALSATGNGRIGVIGTSGTIRNGKYGELIKSANKDIQVFSVACPMFVHLVENGYADHEVARIICKEYLKSIIDGGVDTLILGCTHYPIMKEVISSVMGEGVTLIDPGAEVARYLKKYLGDNELLSDTNKTSNKYYVSDSTADFGRIAGLFLGEDISGVVERIDIEKY